MSAFRPAAAAGLLILALATTVSLTARQTPATGGTFDETLFAALRWRPIGPIRAGHVTAATGTSAGPHIFYAGSPGGGLWKTTDYGRSWSPIFDEQPTGAITAVATGADPNTIYVGTGFRPLASDVRDGAGLFRSTDGGRSWQHLALPAPGAIAHIALGPENPDRLLVVSREGASAGIFRSNDGGRTFARLQAPTASVTDVVLDPRDGRAIYVSAGGSAASFFRSTDDGATWTTSAPGLPDGEALTDLAVNVNGGTTRLFAAAGTAGVRLYRSDDAGQSWRLAATLADAMGPATVTVDPATPEVVYVAADRVWRSTDGGASLTVWERASSGGVERVWVHPTSPAVMMTSGTRGALVSVNGGASWSSPLTLPTPEFTHLTADTAFPYRVCGVQRHVGPVCVASHGERGRIGVTEWAAVPGEPAGVVVADPTEPEVVYAGLLWRYDRRTNQRTHISPISPTEAGVHADAPIEFGTDGKTMYVATNVVWRAASAGQSWTAISPDLTISGGTSGPAARRQPTIVALGLSPIDARTIWAGTSHGRVHVTRDAGATWADVTPAGAPDEARITAIEPSRFDANGAYVVAASSEGRTRTLRTRDAGVSWTSLATGLPPVVHVVREDLFRRGLLLSGTDSGVWMSFDDGGSWASLRLNLPPTPVRDIVVRDADAIIATEGRGFWVLDDIAPLRQVTPDVARAGLFLFRPSLAWRIRATATVAPLLTSEPAFDNAPEGVAFHYVVGSGMSGPLTLEVIETATNEVIRRFTSTPGTGLETALPTTPGLHRIVWDLRYAAAVPPAQPEQAGLLRHPALKGVPVLPGTYQVRLTGGGRVLRQAVTIRMDPRIRTSASDLAALQTHTKAVHNRLGDLAAAFATRPASVDTASVRSAFDDLQRAALMLQEADARPSPATEAFVVDALTRAERALDALR